METISYESWSLIMNNIKVICKKCNCEMLPESTSDTDNVIIYLCELCKHEVKVISIGGK